MKESGINPNLMLNTSNSELGTITEEEMTYPKQNIDDIDDFDYDV